MRLLALLLLAPVSLLLGAIEGTVINGTTGKPQPSVTVSLVQPGGSGMQTLARSTSDASGKFSIDHDLPPPPALLQTEYKGVSYTQVQPPGRPPTGIQFLIYESAAKPPEGMDTAHLIMLEPSASALEISETFLFRNQSKTTFQDAANGSARFYPPKAAGDKVQVSVTPPTRMAISRQAEKASQPGQFKINYPVRPGETRYDLHYTLPASDSFATKLVAGDHPATVVTPLTVRLTGKGIKEIGVEQEVQARLYEVDGTSFDVKIEGTGSIRGRQENDPSEDPGQPKTTEIPAKVYDRMYWVLGLTFGIMALGGALLYRKGTGVTALEDALEISGVWKYFGDFPALRDVELKVTPGSTLALLGRNGAGKTTLLRIVAGLSRPSRGSVKIHGSIGILGHGIALYDELTALENLTLFGRLYALPDPRKRADEMLERVGLARVRDGLAREFSRGMRQRLAVGRAFLHDPEVLLLDEPFTSLDDRAIVVLQSMIKDMRDRGRTIIMSTHQLREALELASHVALLQRGQIVHTGERTQQMLDDTGWLYRTYGDN